LETPLCINPNSLCKGPARAVPELPELVAQGYVPALVRSPPQMGTLEWHLKDEYTPPKTNMDTQNCGGLRVG